MNDAVSWIALAFALVALVLTVVHANSCRCTWHGAASPSPPPPPLKYPAGQTHGVFDPPQPDPQQPVENQLAAIQQPRSPIAPRRLGRAAGTRERLAREATRRAED